MRARDRVGCTAGVSSVADALWSDERGSGGAEGGASGVRREERIFGRRTREAEPSRQQSVQPAANNPGFPVEAGRSPDRVGHVPENLDPSDISMNGGGSGYGLDDHIYQRLLKERIIFLGS